MPINPAIALQLDRPQPVDILGTAGQVLTLKNLVDQGRMGALQLEQAEREGMKRQSIADLARRSGGDMGKFLEGYGEIDPLGALDLRMKTAKSRAELDTARLNQSETLNKLALGAALAVRDAGYTQEAYDRERMRLQSLGVPAQLLATIPPVVSQEYVDSTIASGTTMADRLARERFEREKNLPLSDFGKLLADQARDQEEAARLSSSQFTPGSGTVDAEGNMVAPAVRVGPPPDRFAAIVAQKAQPLPEGFYYDDKGRRQKDEEYWRSRERVAEKGAANVTAVGGDMALGKAATTKVDEGLLDTSAALMRIERIGKEYKPAWSTYLKQGEMGFNAFREKLGGKLSPEQQKELSSYTSWRSSSLDNMNRTIKELTGSAMGVEEANRIMATLPNPDDAPSQFQRKLEDAKQQTRMALARLTYIKRNGMAMQDVPLDKVPSIINERGGVLEQETKRKFPNMSGAEVSRLVKRQLAQEFGLLAD